MDEQGPGDAAPHGEDARNGADRMSDTERAAWGGDLHDLAGGWGVPAALQYSVDQLPGSSTAAVGYDFSITLGLLLGDLATVIETSTSGTGSVLGAPDDGGEHGCDRGGAEGGVHR